MENTTRMMSTIQGLLNKADSTEFPAEAAALRAKAEELMRKYRIEEEQLIAVDPMSVEPIMAEYPVCDTSSRFEQQYLNLAYYCAQHAGVRAHFTYTRGQYLVGLVGYDGDVRLAQWLYASARLMFQTKLEPQIDHTLGDAVNCYNLRQAGLLRKDIAQLLWNDNTSQLRSKVQRLYLAECARRNETPRLTGLGSNAGDYRAAYARSFVEEFSARLRASRDAADSTGGAMVLHGRKERVQEAFYNYFPDERPEPVSTEVTPVETAPAKTKKYKGPTKAQQARTMRKYYSTSARAGSAAGTDAARQVELDRVAGAQRLGE